MRRFFSLSVLAALAAGFGTLSGGTPPACAQGHCIAAMVNDLPITAFEVSQRTRFALMISRQPDSPENRDKQCQTAKKNLDILQGSYPVSAPPAADGKAQVMDDAARKQATDRAAEQVKFYCR